MVVFWLSALVLYSFLAGLLAYLELECTIYDI